MRWPVVVLLLGACDPDTPAESPTTSSAGSGGAATADEQPSAETGASTTDAPPEPGADDTSGGAPPGDTDDTGAAVTTGESEETGTPPVEDCVAQADAVVFDNNPPAGETRVPGLGQCVTVLDGEALWNYHCMWCHSTLDNNDINERTLEKVWWGVDLSESLGNWPLGGLSDYPDAVDAIYQAILASPPPVADHPHPLPEYE